MKKEITTSRYIKIEGKYVGWDSLNEEEKKQIAKSLNERAMKAIGYTKVKTV